MTEKKVSGLKRTNSWKPFYTSIQEAIKGKDYRKKTLASILHFVDPELSMWPGSFFLFLRGMILGPGFFQGRKDLFFNVLERFLLRNKHLFEKAPGQVVETFNQWLYFLFDHELASRLEFDKTYGRGRLSPHEKLILDGEKARQSLLELVEQGIEIPDFHFAVSKKQVPTKKEEAPLVPPSLPITQETKEFIEKLFLKTAGAKQTRFLFLLKQLNSMLQAAKSTFLQNTELFFQERLLPFKDLATKAENVFFFSLSEEELDTLFQKNDENFTKTVQVLIKNKETLLHEIVLQAKERASILENLEQGVIHLRQQLEPLLEKKELHKRVSEILTDLSHIKIPIDLFFQETATIDSTIQKLVKDFSSLSDSVHAQFHLFLKELGALERTCESTQMTLLFRLWEFFTESCPYPDLKPMIHQVLLEIDEKIKKERSSFLRGEISSQEFSQEIIDCTFEHDARILRGEIIGRSWRLQDIRKAVIEAIEEVDRELHYLKIVDASVDEISRAKHELLFLLKKLLDPFTVFYDTFDPESINNLFRHWWLDLERIKRGKEVRDDLFHKEMHGKMPKLIRALLKCLDTFDRMTKEEKKLFQGFQELTLSQEEDKLFQSIDEWLKKMTHPLLLPIACLTTQGQEAFTIRLLQILRYQEKLFSMAKAIQAVKTFEPERIDSLLEPYMLFSSLSSTSEKPQEALEEHFHRSEQTLERIEEELIIELGFLDKKSRMEQGSSLKKLMSQIKDVIPSILHSFEEELKNSHILDLFSPVLDLLKKEASLIQTAFDEPNTEESFFSLLQRFCLLFFQKKLLLTSENPRSLSRAYLILVLELAIESQLSNQLSNQLSKTGSIAEKQKLDTLSMLIKPLWHLISKDLSKKEELIKTIDDFIHIVEKIQLTEYKEIGQLIKVIETCKGTLSEVSPLDVPKISFIPGDLSYLW